MYTYNITCTFAFNAEPDAGNCESHEHERPPIGNPPSSFFSFQGKTQKRVDRHHVTILYQSDSSLNMLMADSENLPKARVVAVIFGFPSFVVNELSWNPSSMGKHESKIVSRLWFMKQTYGAWTFLWTTWFNCYSKCFVYHGVVSAQRPSIDLSRNQAPVILVISVTHATSVNKTCKTCNWGGREWPSK